MFQQETDLGWNIAAITALTDGRLVACANCWRYLDNGRIDWQKGNSELGGVFLAWSEDKGKTSSSPRRVNIAPMRTAWVRDSILELPDGKLLLPLEGHMHRRAIAYDTVDDRSRSYILCSGDGGPAVGLLGNDCLRCSRHYKFQRVGNDPPGRWTLAGHADAPSAFPAMLRPVNSMPRRVGYEFMVTSHDNGISWSRPVNYRHLRLPGRPYNLAGWKSLVMPIAIAPSLWWSMGLSLKMAQSGTRRMFSPSLTMTWIKLNPPSPRVCDSDAGRDRNCR